MARSKSFFGLRRGSAGGFTYSKGANGEQITRAKAEFVKNPKTPAQNVQRMVFAAVSKQRSLWQRILTHSFQSKQVAAESMAAFSKANLDLCRRAVIGALADTSVSDFPDMADFPRAVLAAKGEYGALLQPCIRVSSGTLLTCNPVFRRYNNSYVQPLVFPISRDVETVNNLEGLGQTEAVDSPYRIATGSTWRKYIQQLGMRGGDTLTFMFTRAVAPFEGAFNWVEVEEFGYVQFVLRRDVSSVALDEEVANSGLAEVFEIYTNLPFGDVTSSNSFFRAGIFYFGADSAATDYVSFGVQCARNVASCAIIMSKQMDDGTWLRSSSDACLNPINFNLFNNYPLLQALGTWETGDELLLNGNSTYTSVGEAARTPSLPVRLAPVPPTLPEGPNMGPGSPTSTAGTSSINPAPALEVAATTAKVKTKSK